MKKLFYIVLVVVILLVIGKFLNQEATMIPSEPEAVVIQEHVTANAGATAPEALVAEPANPDTIGDGEVVEEMAEEVVEENPSETADEDETVIAE